MALVSSDVIIEISKGSNLKYEISKETNLLRLDRVLHTSMFYPGNYGYFPQTLAGDGDPLDVLVLTDCHTLKSFRRKKYTKALMFALLGDIFLKNNELDKAKDKYNFVIREYPNNTASSLALQLLKNME